MNTRLERIKDLVLSLGGFAQWEEVDQLIASIKPSNGLAFWDYVPVACEAVGGDAEDSLPGAAAIFSMTLSIRLIDDILDEEPTGFYRRTGAGQAANIAFALQAAASRVMHLANVKPSSMTLILNNLARMASRTSYGQYLDWSTAAGTDESAYWKIVQTKTPPLIGSSLYTGAIMGGATVDIAKALEDLGVPIGTLIQIGDDLSDAFGKSNLPDWNTQNNNIAILYAKTANHPESETFREISTQTDQRDKLHTAQQILIRSGALSFACYQMIKNYHEARDILGRISLINPGGLKQLLADLISPASDLFKRAGVKMPEFSDVLNHETQ